MFSKLELRAFQILSQSGRSSVSNLALGLGISRSAVSRAVTSLEKKGFVESRKGRRKEVQVARSVSAYPFEEMLRANPHINFARVFENSNFTVLSALCFRETAPFKSILRTTGVSEITARRSLSKLADAGIVSRRRGGYGIILPTLGRCVAEYLRLILMAKEGAVGSSFLQVGPAGFVRSDRKCSDDFTLTGLSVFPKYGVQLVFDFRDYAANAFFKPKAPRVEEAVLHALVRSTKNESSREASYCLLVIAKNWRRFDWDYFFEHSEDFAVAGDAKRCRDFFQGFSGFLCSGTGINQPLITFPPHGVPAYPDFESFAQLCGQYGVDTKALCKGRH